MEHRLELWVKYDPNDTSRVEIDQAKNDEMAAATTASAAPAAPGGMPAGAAFAAGFGSNTVIDARGVPGLREEVLKAVADVQAGGNPAELQAAVMKAMSQGQATSMPPGMMIPGAPGAATRTGPDARPRLTRSISSRSSTSCASPARSPRPNSTPRRRRFSGRRRVGARMARIPINISDHVGRTPMVQLTRIWPESRAQLFAKLESFNPGGSVKDRIGVAMIEAAEAEGRIEPGRTTIVEATSGNTGIALAFVCAAKGYELVLTLPQGMSRERESLLRLYGARVEVTESLGGMSEAVDAARALAARRRRVPARPVHEPGQPGGAPPHHRAGDSSGARRPGRRARGGRRHGRDDHRRRRVRSRSATRAARSWRSSRASSAVLSGGRPGPHRIQGIGAGFVPRCSTASCSTR